MENSSSKPVSVVIGAGPGLGASLARRFVAAYRVAILARNADYLKALAGQIRKGGAKVLDLSRGRAVQSGLNYFPNRLWISSGAH